MEGEIGVLQVEKKIRNRVKRQMEKTQREYYLNEQMKAIQKELGETEDGRDEISEMEKRIKKTQAQQGSAREGQRRAEEAAHDEPDVGRGDGGAQLPRLAAVDSVAQADQDHQGPEVRRGRAQRRPSRPREGQGAHPRVPRRPAARRQDEGPDPVPGRPAGRRQDLARQVDRQGDGPQLRAHVAGRRARRGRDPRPSPDLYRLAAGQGHPEHEEGEVVEPALPARRDRQARRGFPRRSVVGAARGARSRAELDLQRPLSRGRLRPVERDVHHHGQLAAHGAAADGPHGDHPARRLHRGREGRDRPQASDRQADRGERPEGGRARHPRRCRARPRALLHARGRRA